MGYLNRLGAKVREINKANGWSPVELNEWQDKYKVPAILALIHSEVSEALEAFRAGDKPNFHEELADIVIHVLDLAPGICCDLDREIEEKLEKNKKRAYRHGGKKI